MSLWKLQHQKEGSWIHEKNFLEKQEIYIYEIWRCNREEEIVKKKKDEDLVKRTTEPYIYTPTASTF